MLYHSQSCVEFGTGGNPYGLLEQERHRQLRKRPCSLAGCAWSSTATKDWITRAWVGFSWVWCVAGLGAALMSSIGYWKNSFRPSVSKSRSFSSLLKQTVPTSSYLGKQLMLTPILESSSLSTLLGRAMEAGLVCLII